MSAAPDFRVAIEVVDRMSAMLRVFADRMAKVGDAVRTLNRQLLAFHERVFGHPLRQPAPRPRNHHPHRRPHRARRLAARRLR